MRAVTRSLETWINSRGGEAKADAVFDNWMAVWVRTVVQFPPQRCTGDGSTLMLWLDTPQHVARQGCKAGGYRAERETPVSSVAMGRYTNVLLNRRQNRQAKAG